MIDAGIRHVRRRCSACVMQHRVRTIVIGRRSLVIVVVALGSELRRDFFPEVDAGAFEMTVRGGQRHAHRGDGAADRRGRAIHPREARQEERADRSSAISASPPTGRPPTRPIPGRWMPMINVQLTENRSALGPGIRPAAADRVRRRQPLHRPRIRVRRGRHDRRRHERGQTDADQHPHRVELARKGPQGRPEHPEEGRARAGRRRLPHPAAARLSRVHHRRRPRKRRPTWGSTQTDVMKNVVAALNSSVQFNKHNFWIDPVSHNQYYVGVQYPEATSKRWRRCWTCRSPAPCRKMTVPLRNIASTPPRHRARRSHAYQPRADDRPAAGRSWPRLGARRRRRERHRRPVRRSRARAKPGVWTPYDPDAKDKPAHGREQTHDQRRILADERDVLQPGPGTGQRGRADLFPDGRPVPLVPHAAGHHVGGPDRRDGRGA